MTSRDVGAVRSVRTGWRALWFRKVKAQQAFNRIELLVVLASLAVLLAVFSPALAAARSGTERAVCFNNLREIGRAVHTWTANFSTRLPPWWIPAADGGTRPAPTAAWRQFSVFSNELASPKVLACPADVGVKRSAEWSEFVLNPAYRQDALSYVVGLHAMPDSPRAWLSGDRNLRDDRFSSCESGLLNINAVDTNPSVTVLQWTNGVVHGELGHALLNDGAVEFTASARLRELLLAPNADSITSTEIHFLKAR